MSYVVALTSTGQMTLPKELREFLGLEGEKRVVLKKEGRKVVIERKQTKDEYYKDVSQHLSAKAKQILEEEQKNGGRPPIRDIMREIYNSPEMKQRWKEKMGE